MVKFKNTSSKNIKKLEPNNFKTSDKVQNIPEALSIYINQIVYSLKRKGKDIITLSLGEAFFEMPLFDFHKLDYVKGFHYSDSQGLPELREKISEYYKKQYNVSVNPDKEILISCGSKLVIYMVFMAILNPNDEILIHEPGWLSYQEQARLVNAIPKFVPYNQDINHIDKWFNEKTKILIINNPNNPAGRLYTSDELKTLYRKSKEKGIYLLVDEAYSDFINDKKFTSVASLNSNMEGIIAINSLSKNMGMSGWRVGYVLSNKHLIKQILKINQHIVTCAPTLLQQYMTKYFDQVVKITLPQADDVVLKRERVENYINKIGLKTIKGGSTFYFMINIERFPGNSYELSMLLLLKHQIAVVPGSAYGESTDRFIRIGVGTESDERIFNALSVIKDCIFSKKFDKKIIEKYLKSNNLDPFETKK